MQFSAIIFLILIYGVKYENKIDYKFFICFTPFSYN